MKLIWLVVYGLLTACVSTPGSDSFDIDGLIFKNLSQSNISNIRLTVQTNNRFISCSNIVVGGVCSTVFPARRYAGEKLAVSWSTDNRSFNSRDNQISNQTTANNLPNRLVLVDILDDGALSISLIGS